MRILSCVAVLGALSLAPTAMAGAASDAPPGAAPAARLSVVQAVPGASVDLAIDGRDVSASVATGKVLGPYRLDAGEHRLDFSSSDGLALSTSVTLEAGEDQDVVLHLPASIDGDPVINAYRTPTSPISSGNARVLVAHTATVAPADVVVDGNVVFSNIANGEYATADVPAGKHVVALVATGKSDPILGPLDVTLTAGAVTSVYAIGNPADDSMELVAHETPLALDDADAPSSIDTGSAGLAARFEVLPFRVAAPARPDR